MTLITPGAPQQKRLSVAEILERIRLARFSPQAWQRHQAAKQLIDDAADLCTATIAVGEQLAELRQQGRDMALILGALVLEAGGSVSIAAVKVTAFDPRRTVSWEDRNGIVVVTVEEVPDGGMDGGPADPASAGDGGPGGESDDAGPLDREGVGAGPVPVMQPAEGPVPDLGAGEPQAHGDSAEVRGVPGDTEVTS